jgi:hypothetical protein
MQAPLDRRSQLSVRRVAVGNEGFVTHDKLQILFNLRANTTTTWAALPRTRARSRLRGDLPEARLWIVSDLPSCRSPWRNAIRFWVDEWQRFN